VAGCPIKLSRTPVEYCRPPPKLGEHDALLDG
jgi:crotonobetainyl-CoA:carnitine CoA-transferase CaiB-like acyl-CoA transferase